MAVENSNWDGEGLVDDEDLFLEDLSLEDVPEFEAQLLRNPSDRRTRLKLLQFASGGQFHDPVQRQRYREHSHWFIENEPAARLHERWSENHPRNDPSGYAEGERLWLAHLRREPENLAILRNAAAYFTSTNPARARSLLERGERLDPGNADWPASLGDLHDLVSRPGMGERDPKLVRESLGAYQRAMTKWDGQGHRARALLYAARVALDAGELALARQYANELLQSNETRPDFLRTDGDAIYIGHSVLGLLALGSGDLDEAGRELLEAGRTPGSPVLGSFGPELDLADALLQLGRSEVVLEFLELCTRFWDEPVLRRWIARIQAGERPRLDRHDAGDE